MNLTEKQLELFMSGLKLMQLKGGQISNFSEKYKHINKIVQEFGAFQLDLAEVKQEVIALFVVDKDVLKSCNLSENEFFNVYNGTKEKMQISKLEKERRVRNAAIRNLIESNFKIGHEGEAEIDRLLSDLAGLCERQKRELKIELDDYFNGRSTDHWMHLLHFCKAEELDKWIALLVKNNVLMKEMNFVKMVEYGVNPEIFSKMLEVLKKSDFWDESTWDLMLKKILDSIFGVEYLNALMEHNNIFFNDVKVRYATIIGLEGSVKLNRNVEILRVMRWMVEKSCNPKQDIADITLLCKNVENKEYALKLIDMLEHKMLLKTANSNSKKVVEAL